MPLLYFMFCGCLFHKMFWRFLIRKRRTLFYLVIIIYIINYFNLIINVSPRSKVKSRVLEFETLHNAHNVQNSEDSEAIEDRHEDKFGKSQRKDGFETEFKSISLDKLSDHEDDEDIFFDRHKQRQIGQIPIKYILKWSSMPNDRNFIKLKKGRDSFIENQCKFTNCFVTDDKNHLIDESKFDAILFSSYDVSTSNQSYTPNSRTVKQKYVFIGTEPPALNQLVLEESFNNFFNWTWTYRLDSDISWKYVTIYDLDGKVVGPSIRMMWVNEMKPIKEDVKKILSSKTKIAAWFTSICRGNMMQFARKVNIELRKHGLSVDIYGKCGKYKIGRFDNATDWFKMVEKSYFFYFAFEKALDDDYVTGKVLIALNNFAVPVVFGGAEYSRFLPYGSYLDARALGPERLADNMMKIMQNPIIYHDFFRWRNHYRYQLTMDSKELCNICTALNDHTMVQRYSNYRDFRNWWNRRRWTELYDKIVEILQNKTYTIDLMMKIIKYVS